MVAHLILPNLNKNHNFFFFIYHFKKKFFFFLADVDLYLILTISAPIWWLIAVPAEMTGFPAGITRLGRSFRAITSDVAGFVAIIAWRLALTLGAIFCYVTDSIAMVTPILLFFAVSCKMTESVAFVALITPSTSSIISTIAISTTATVTTSLRTFAGKMTGPVTFVTSTRAHLRKHLKFLLTMTSDYDVLHTLVKF